MWESKVDDYKRAYYFTLAPLIAKGKVMVGTSGGEFGIRGYVAALDAQTGKEVWRTHTVPAPGEPGHDSWQGEDHWKTGGVLGVGYGPLRSEAESAYWGTGNPSPWVGDMHPATALHGVGHRARRRHRQDARDHQYTPNESWDWDEVSAPLLIDFKRNGRDIQGAGSSRT